MGLLMEFRIGDARALASAFESMDFEQLDSLSRGSADFSLRLSPNDLDYLVEGLCLASGRSPLRFEDVASGPIAGHRDESGVFLLSRAFLDIAAALPEGSASEIAERWMARVAEESGDPSVLATEDTVLAISDLLRIGRKAALENLEMIYCWSL